MIHTLSVICSLNPLNCSFVGRSIDLQTKGHPSRNLGSGRWVVESLSRPVLSDRKQDRQNRGWDLQQRHQRLRSLQVGIPKKQISGFQAGTSSSHQSHPLACHIFFFYCAHHAYLISYHHSDVIQFSFSQIFCMPTWTLFFRPTRLPFKLWDLPGRNQSINKIWQNLCVETICQENWHRNSARTAFCCSFVRLATFTRLVC